VGRLSATYLAGEGLGFRYAYQSNGWLAQTQGVYFPVGVTNLGQVAPSQVTPFLQVDRSYNPRGLMTGLTNSLVTGTNTLTRLSAFSGMSYDAGGNRLGETASVPARGQAPDLSRSVTYQYDTLDQLTAETSTGGVTGTTYAETFVYDLAGNPTSTSGRHGTAAATFNADNQNTKTAYTGTGDPLGLYLFTDTSATAPSFDPEDRLASVRAYTFYAAYDGDGLRTVEGYSGSYYLTDGERPVAEVSLDTTGAPTVYAFNGFGASGLEWRGGGGNGSASYDSYSAYTYDPQGSVVEPVSLSYMGGSTRVIHVPTSSSYDGFGLGYTATADGSGREDPAVGFGGQWGYYRDYTTGLSLLTHRYYDAGAGRFVTRDPIGYTGGINLYGFAGNNPVNESDPDGFAPRSWLDLLLDPFGLNDSVTRGQAHVQEFLSKHPSAKAANDAVRWGTENFPTDGGGMQIGAVKSTAELLPRLKGMSVKSIGRVLQRAGFTRTRVSASAARNETWDHSDGSQVLIHPYGGVSTGTFKTGNNAHMHKYGPGGVKLNDRGLPDPDPNNTHIGIPNPNNLPSVRGRPHGR